MTGTLFIEQLKQSWRTALYWGFGVGLLLFYIGAVIEDPEIIASYQSILSAFPPEMLSAFGLSDASLLTSQEGFVAFAGFAYGGLALTVFGVISGLNIITNDEDSGMMNIILGLPTPRWQVIVERFLAYTVILVIIDVLLFTGIVLSRIVFNLDLDMTTMLYGSVNLMPAVLAVMAVTVLIGSIFSNKLIVTTLSGGFVLGSYVLSIVSDAVDSSQVPFADLLGQISLFTYLDSEDVVIQGSLNPGNMAVLLGAALIAIIISLYAFENRDIQG